MVFEILNMLSRPSNNKKGPPSFLSKSPNEKQFCFTWPYALVLLAFKEQWITTNHHRTPHKCTF